MSTRYGMADGRCFTSVVSTNLITSQLAKQANLSPTDSHGLREYLQKAGPDALKSILEPSQCLKVNNLRI